MLCGRISPALGTVFDILNLTSFGVGTLIFLGFAVGRRASISADGKPNKQILQRIGFAPVLGGLNLVCPFMLLIN